MFTSSGTDRFGAVISETEFIKVISGIWNEMSENFVIFDKIIGNPFGLAKELSKVTQSVPKLAGVFVNSATNIMKEVRRALAVGKSFVSFVSKRLLQFKWKTSFK